MNLTCTAFMIVCTGCSPWPIAVEMTVVSYLSRACAAPHAPALGEYVIEVL